MSVWALVLGIHTPVYVEDAKGRIASARMSDHLDRWTDNLAIVLDELIGGLSSDEVDQVVTEILLALRAWGDDLVGHLDPPRGLRTWLESHGLSLVPTHEPKKPRSWDEIQEPTNPILTPVKAQVSWQVGQYVRYRTVPRGPRNQSLLGAGRIVAVHQAETDGEKLVLTVKVQNTSSAGRVHLVPEDGDFVESTGGQGGEGPGS